MMWTETALRALPADKLRALYDNASRRAGDLAADDVVTAIEALGVPPARGGLKLDSPMGRKMAQVIATPDSVEAAIQASREGSPPMAAIDPILQRALGPAYATTYEATIQAGYLTAKMMRAHAFETNGRRAALPAGCVAKTAALFVHIPTRKS